MPLANEKKLPGVARCRLPVTEKRQDENKNNVEAGQGPAFALRRITPGEGKDERLPACHRRSYPPRTIGGRSHRPQKGLTSPSHCRCRADGTVHKQKRPWKLFIRMQGQRVIAAAEPRHHSMPVMRNTCTFRRSLGGGNCIPIHLALNVGSSVPCAAR